jgi:hypothetical protein
MIKVSEMKKSLFCYIHINNSAQIRLTAGVTGRLGMLAPPRYLIPPLVCPRVRVYPIL